MRRLVLAVWMLVACVGCGKTKAPPSATGDSGAAAVSDGGDANQGSGGKVGAGASGGSGASAGSGTGAQANGGAGGRMLPPDGEVAPAQPLHKLDLLLLIDNSLNMVEKQLLLRDGVEFLLTSSNLSADDVHIGVITSSMGSHGAPAPSDVCVGASYDDHARLIGSLRPGVRSFNSSGFLAWGLDSDPDLTNVVKDFDDMVTAVGEQGCGYEASLESWYRFLVEPSPPASIVLAPGSTLAAPQGVDMALLQQRQAFLRPDSVLAIVVLSDENDCSVVDEGYGWLVARAATRMFRSTSQCASNPNDPCCQSCGEQAANAGCPALASDAECAKGVTLGTADDSLNLRCYDQKRRFGFDLLQPISRYRDGLTRQTAFDRDGNLTANPIFAGKMRHPSQVILAGIVGVPWQDLADQASLTGPGLNNLTAAELVAQNRWPAIVGDPKASPPVPPGDPFMFETPDDRSARSSVNKNPFVAATIVPATSTDPQANVINGHESVNVGNLQLQAACIFPLPHPKACDQVAQDQKLACRCYPTDADENNAVCQPPGGGPADLLQHWSAAFPSLRQLQLLQSLGNNAVTASICPKTVSPGVNDYGYRPAMRALAARIETALHP